MGNEGDPLVGVGDEAETVDHLCEDEEEEVDIELLKGGALKIAAKVAEGLGGVDTSITLEYLVSGAYNHVWLLKYLPKTAADTNDANEQINKVVLRIPKESAQSLHPYQLRHEVACLQFLCENLPDIPAPRVLNWDDRTGHAFIAQEFIDGQRLSVVWSQLAEDQKATITWSIANVVAKLGETRFDFIGGLDPDSQAGPTIEAGKIFNGRAKFHSHDCYNIGPYSDSKDYILSCYDREIYYYSHADKDDILMDAFENVTVPEFIESLRLEKENVSRNAQLFQALNAEPRVLVHEDFHAGNMLVRDGYLVGIVDWEFSGVYPLSELLGAIQLIQVSSPYRSESTEEEEEEWDRRYRQDLEKIVRQRGWSEGNIKALLEGGLPDFQKARTVMFPDG
ncbi:Phosphotransferase enzyme family [Aspergillus sclerotialis]|uniref:Phosphotransferase enzyme family n=1 Tax=Aspergillus sclerotialis TaxID=2070753 RepID=A0A3A2ZDK6_9EURO|nr:Phosphotransferase enzyme family [Aspergillus sclerotialis]